MYVHSIAARGSLGINVFSRVYPIPHTHTRVLAREFVYVFYSSNVFPRDRIPPSRAEFIAVKKMQPDLLRIYSDSMPLNYERRRA